MGHAETTTCDFCEAAAAVPAKGGLPPGWAYYDLDRVEYGAFSATRTSWEFEVCRDCHERRVDTRVVAIVKTFLRKVRVLK